jgi:GntR family transcriptional regulator
VAVTTPRNGREPLHVQVSTALRSEIKDHRLPPGSLLPSEAALQERFGVARSVVRQALATLVAEGLVTRGRGRGSVVAPPREHHRLVQRSSGLFAQMAAEGQHVETRVISLEERPASAEAEWLRTERVIALERLRSVNAEPVAYIRTYLPLPACAGLTARELTNGSLHAVLAQRFGLKPTAGRRHIRAVAADTELASALSVAPGAPLLLLEGRGSDQHGVPLEVFATWHRADQIAFDIDVSDDTSDAALSGVVPIPHNAPHPTTPSKGIADDDRLQRAADLARQAADLLEELTHLDR